jgi:hypothetical protein
MELTPEQMVANEHAMDVANELSDAYNQPREVLIETMARLILITQELA